MSDNFDYTLIQQMTEEQLASEVRKHNRLYELNQTEITDEQFDLLTRRLTELNPDNAALHEFTSPEVASAGKVRHTSPMLSLDKAYSLEEVLEWARKHARTKEEALLIQPKYDGISANYISGVLATRGDGEVGENITDKLPLIELETTGYTGPVDRPVRGEIIIRDDDFHDLYSTIRKKDGKHYKNSRNAVAGIMGLKDISDMLAQKAKLTLVDYDMVSYDVPLSDLEERWPLILEEIEALPYPMDGIVIKFADTEFAESLGSTAHHPRGQIAFKFSGIRCETKLLNVDWSFGKNCLTPVAELEPVDIGGITIRHASLHNVQNIIDKDIEIGDTVTVERAGDVIPYIVSAVPGTDRKSCLITSCPCCESELVREGPELCCQNADCFETKVQRLLAAVKNIGIERLGEPNIRRMMTTLGVNRLRDIFDLEVQDILQLEGFKEKSANNLYGEIQSAKHVSDFQVLAALNIQGIGKTVAKMILTEYTIDELRSLPHESLSAIKGIGPERADALERELKLQSDILDELLACVNMVQTKGTGTKPTICFTGKMPEKRSYYEELASQHGYEPVSAVSGDLAILVALDIDSGSSKLSKARKAGVAVMALDHWLDSVDKGDTPANQQPSEQTSAPVAEAQPVTTDDDLFAAAPAESPTEQVPAEPEPDKDGFSQAEFDF